MSEVLLGSRVAQVIDEPGYQLRLEWSAEPYLDAPEGHWCHRQHCAESGEGAAVWLQQWTEGFAMAATTPGVGRIHDLKLSRRKVGEWESCPDGVAPAPQWPYVLKVGDKLTFPDGEVMEVVDLDVIVDVIDEASDREEGRWGNPS